MSRRLWRCRNPECPVPHGAVLGRITTDAGLVLNADIARFAVFCDTRRAVVWCPACGALRNFHGDAVFSAHDPSMR